MIQQLVNILVEKDMLKIYYFPLLINENVTKLDLSSCRLSMVTDQVLKLLQFRCKNLVYLNLAGCTRLSNMCLNEALANLSFLKYLNLSQCHGACTDSTLCQLSKCCPNVQELLLESCIGITDSGLQALLDNNQTNQFGCLSICHLNVSSTSVTTQSLWHILLKLPWLKKLSFSDIKYGETRGDHSPFVDEHPLLELEHLDVSCTYISEYNLKILCEKCPKLAEIKINYSDKLETGFLHYLTSLSCLRSLTCNVGSPLHEVTFEHLETFLAERGHQLQFLDLSGMDAIQVSVLCFYCNALQHLVLADCQNTNASLPSWDALTRNQRDQLKARGLDGSMFSHFCQLKSLNLDRTTFRTSDGSHSVLYAVSMLLTSHCNLEKLSLQEVNIDDEVLIKMLDSSSSVALKTLELSHCDNITMDAIDRVLHRCPQLQLLDLSYCHQLCWRDVAEIHNFLKRIGSHLKVLWC